MTAATLASCPLARAGRRPRLGASVSVPALLFVNTGGSYLVLLRMSAAVSAQTRSGLLPGVVLAAPWLLALVLARPLHGLLRERRPERLTRFAEGASLAGTAVLAALPLAGNTLIVAAVCLLLLRGFFEAVTRSAVSVLLRATIRADRLYRVNTIAEIAKLAGTGAGAALAGPLSMVVPLRVFIVLNAATLTISSALAWTLPSEGTRPSGPDGQAAGGKPGLGNFLLCLKNVTLRRLFVLFLLAAFWQGFHTIAVNTVPREVLGGGTSLVGAFVALAALGIFAGSMAAMFLERHLNRLPQELWGVVPMVPLLAAIFAGRTVPTLIGYTAFMIAFEIVYVCCNNRIIATASPDEVATVVAMRATVMPLGVVVSVIGVGLLAGVASPRAVTLVVALVSCAVMAWSWIDGRR